MSERLWRIWMRLLTWKHTEAFSDLWRESIVKVLEPTDLTRIWSSEICCSLCNSDCYFGCFYFCLYLLLTLYFCISFSVNWSKQIMALCWTEVLQHCFIATVGSHNTCQQCTCPRHLSGSKLLFPCWIATFDSLRLIWPQIDVCFLLLAFRTSGNWLLIIISKINFLSAADNLCSNYFLFNSSNDESN